MGRLWTGTILLIAVGSLTTDPAWVQGATGDRYEVAVTNATRGQSFTPLLLVTHTSAVNVFGVGGSPSEELRELAEEWNTLPLATLLGARPLEVRDVVTGSGLLTPGVTTRLEIRGGGSFDRLSLLAMLIPTNDGFVGLDGVPLPTGDQVLTLYPLAYDAGTEQNDEACASIPGPAYAECGGSGGGARAGSGEGAVTVHAGMHGIGDFNAARRDWRSTPAKITIQRLP